MFIFAINELRCWGGGQLLDLFLVLGCLWWRALGLHTPSGVLQTGPHHSPTASKSSQLCTAAEPSSEGAIPATPASIVQGTFLPSPVLEISNRMMGRTPLEAQQKACNGCTVVFHLHEGVWWPVQTLTTSSSGQYEQADELTFGVSVWSGVGTFGPQKSPLKPPPKVFFFFFCLFVMFIISKPG